MALSINEIAKCIGSNYKEDTSLLIKGVSSFEDAGPFEITFAGDKKFLNRINDTNATAVIVPLDFELKTISEKIFLKVKNPKISFFNLVSHFYPVKKVIPHISDSAVIGENTTLGSNLSIGANVVVGNDVTLGNDIQIMPGTFIGDDVIIGDNCLIKPNVTIFEKTKIGNHVIIHSGSVIGSDGYGFAFENNVHQKIIHTGYVQIGNDVEIGAVNTIDRGTIGKTVIGNGVKTDNQVHIAHNVKIGDNSLIVAQVGIAGSTTIGKNVILAGKAGISGHLSIGDGSIVGPYSGVHTNIPENQIVSGIPQLPHQKWKKVVSVLSRLPDIRKKIFSFEKRLTYLETTQKNMEKK